MINIYLLITFNFLTQTEKMHQGSWIQGRDLFEYSVTKFLFYRNQFPRWQNYTGSPITETQVCASSH